MKWVNYTIGGLYEGEPYCLIHMPPPSQPILVMEKNDPAWDYVCVKCVETLRQKARRSWEAITGRAHLNKDPRVIESLSRAERFRLRLWSKAAEYAEARWLEANGWRETRLGWALPDWHPQKGKPRRSPRRRDMRVAMAQAKPLNDFYDQNHAANSQRFYNDVSQTRPMPRRRAPQWTAYVRWAPYQNSVLALTLALIILAVTRDSRWASGLFSLAAVLGLCVSLAISHKVRRELELDWTETRLRKKDP